LSKIKNTSFDALAKNRYSKKHVHAKGATFKWSFIASEVLQTYPFKRRSAVYHGKMLASAYRADWIFGEWSDPEWKHEHCACRVVTTKSGEKCMRGGHRERYYSHNGRSRKSRQLQRRRMRRQYRSAWRQLLDEMS
jgi:hypothetical protein